MRYIVGFASWMAVCFIALSRCFTLICPETSFKLFTSPWGQFSVFFTTWTLAVAYISPILTEVKVAEVRNTVHATLGFWCQGIPQKLIRTFDTSFETKMMVKSGAIEIIFKPKESFQLTNQLTSLANLAKKASQAEPVSWF